MLKESVAKVFNRTIAILEGKIEFDSNVIEEKMKEILDAAQKFDVKEYQKSGRGYYGYSEKIKRGA